MEERENVRRNQTKARSKASTANNKPYRMRSRIWDIWCYDLSSKDFRHYCLYGFVMYTNMAPLKLAVLTVCGIPSAYHPLFWASQCLHGISVSVSQLHSLTSQWLLTDTLVLLYTV
jgi:hypothetical protein